MSETTQHLDVLNDGVALTQALADGLLLDKQDFPYSTWPESSEKSLDMLDALLERNKRLLVNYLEVVNAELEPQFSADEKEVARLAHSVEVTLELMKAERFSEIDLEKIAEFEEAISRESVQQMVDLEHPAILDARRDLEPWPPTNRSEMLGKAEQFTYYLEVVDRAISTSVDSELKDAAVLSSRIERSIEAIQEVGRVTDYHRVSNLLEDIQEAAGFIHGAEKTSDAKTIDLGNAAILDRAQTACSFLDKNRDKIRELQFSLELLRDRESSIINIYNKQNQLVEGDEVKTIAAIREDVVRADAKRREDAVENLSVFLAAYADRMMPLTPLLADEEEAVTEALHENYRQLVAETEVIVDLVPDHPTLNDLVFNISMLTESGLVELPERMVHLMKQAESIQEVQVRDILSQIEALNNTTLSNLLAIELRQERQQKEEEVLWQDIAAEFPYEMQRAVMQEWYFGGAAPRDRTPVLAAERDADGNAVALNAHYTEAKAAGELEGFDPVDKWRDMYHVLNGTFDLGLGEGDIERIARINGEHLEKIRRSGGNPNVDLAFEENVALHSCKLFLKTAQIYRESGLLDRETYTDEFVLENAVEVLPRQMLLDAVVERGSGDSGQYAQLTGIGDIEELRREIADIHEKTPLFDEDDIPRIRDAMLEAVAASMREDLLVMVVHDMGEAYGEPLDAHTRHNNGDAATINIEEEQVVQLMLQKYSPERLMEADSSLSESDFAVSDEEWLRLFDIIESYGEHYKGAATKLIDRIQGNLHVAHSGLTEGDMEAFYETATNLNGYRLSSDHRLQSVEGEKEMLWDGKLPDADGHYMPVEDEITIQADGSVKLESTDAVIPGMKARPVMFVDDLERDANEYLSVGDSLRDDLLTYADAYQAEHGESVPPIKVLEAITTTADEKININYTEDRLEVLLKGGNGGEHNLPGAMQDMFTEALFNATFDNSMHYALANLASQARLAQIHDGHVNHHNIAK